MWNVANQIKKGEGKIALVGLGYVGLPIAVAFSKKVPVIGFDINVQKIQAYMSGTDATQEVGNEGIANCKVEFTSDEGKLKDARFIIVAVPTPVNADHTPDLSPVEEASKIVGRNLMKDSIVVYESTVYPGVTEEICVPILERESGLKCGTDFKVGYSPERINPGDKVHRLENIVKIVSGMDDETLDAVADVYSIIIDAGVYRAESIKVAEAAKVIENSQRDINIAFMNELSIIFNKMGISTKAVLEAAGTKWNFLPFQPGLVGGHCIGVDPYYLTYKTEELGYHSQIILAGRRINDDMGKYIGESLIKQMIAANILIQNARVAILGITFKEDCPDTRNSKIIDIINTLDEYGIKTIISDDVADVAEAERLYGIKVVPLDEVKNVDAVVVAVAHGYLKELSVEDYETMYNVDQMKILLDIKSIYKKEDFIERGYKYWSL